MSEPMTFKNSAAVFLEKGWEKGKKSTAQPYNRSSVCCGSLGGRVTRHVCLLSFQSICHIIKSLAWELIGEFCLVFLQPAALKPCRSRSESPCCVYPCVSHYTAIMNLTFFHTSVEKTQYVEK